MVDHPSKENHRDDKRAPGGEDYEVRYFAEQNGITVEQARELVRRFGDDRAILEREARNLRRGA